MSNNETDPNAAPGLWRRAVGVDGAADPAGLQELLQIYWYPVYVWWRRAGLDAATSVTATHAVVEVWMGEGAPTADDAGVDRVRDWAPLKLHKLADEGVKLRQAPAIEIDETWAEERYALEPAESPMRSLEDRGRSPYWMPLWPCSRRSI